MDDNVAKDSMIGNSTHGNASSSALTRENETPPQEFYSLEEAAAVLELRAEDVAALLFDVGIDRERAGKSALTCTDVEHLRCFVQPVRRLLSESRYSGVNL